MKLLKDFINDESGLTAVEYAIAGSLVSAALVLAFTELGDAATDSLDCMDTAINAAPGAGVDCT
ncbi:Flp family type IVb pilin [Thalassomonas sp. M1454]|uniref:Flp family type IVb pilin n=1 Tax=Thalassomonas sp. M1454 TaxID=2594477 RepID=UPI00117D48E7|nr:Flp family type IVb pilin [Thalassomonas sp. M1454]TRX54447.1 Flp family type IVb pilin [Thalassomonas sp. M1454]